MGTAMPAIFFGHGNPMNALTKNGWTEAWSAVGRTIETPRAILCVSAHWYLPATLVTAMPAPRTIHDFGGFPRELFQVQYPAPGDPELAQQIRELLKPIDVSLDQTWGLDHGTWSVLCHVFPNADVPVVQLSIDETQSPDFHFELGKRLSALRDEGILICGSGNLVHNLHTYAWGKHMPEPYDWAVRFEATARELMQNRDFADQLRHARSRRAPVDPNTGSLLTASLRARRCPRKRYDQLSSRGRRRRLDLNARHQLRLAFFVLFVINRGNNLSAPEV